VELTDVLVGGFKPPQTGWIDTSAVVESSGEDGAYVDVTISAVDVSKALASVDGGYCVQSNSLNGASATPAAKALAWYGAGGVNASISYSLTARLINATTLRLAATGVHTINVSVRRMSARWTVVEGK
jgi:hypothetical protein